MYRRPIRPLAATSIERRNDRSEEVSRRPTASKAFIRPLSRWDTNVPLATPSRPVSPIVEDDEATTPKLTKKVESGSANEERTPTARSSFVVRRSNSRVSASPPSAAASARHDHYSPWQAQSAYRTGSISARDRDRDWDRDSNYNRDRGRDGDRDWDRDSNWNRDRGRDREQQRDPALFDPRTTRSIRVPKWAFAPGLIIRALVHEPGLREVSNYSAFTAADRHYTDSKFGSICSKYRKLIVIGTYEDHYMAIPLYTHNGRGLRGKSNPDEYVSVQDHRQSKQFTALSSHNPLVTKHLTEGIDLFDPKSTAHITFPVCRRYELAVVHEGFLQETSTKKLLHLVRKFLLPPDSRSEGFELRKTTDSYTDSWKY